MSKTELIELKNIVKRFEESLSALNDIIDKTGDEICKALEGAGYPLDMNDVPCALDDVVWHDGKKMKVVAISHKGSLSVRDFSRNDGKGAIWVKAKYVMHEEPDTQQKIDEEVQELSTHLISMVNPNTQWSCKDYLETEIHKLLERQRKLDVKAVE